MWARACEVGFCAKLCMWAPRASPLWRESARPYLTPHPFMIHPSVHPPSSHAGTTGGPVTSYHLAADGLSDPAVTTGHDAAQRCASTGRAAGDPPLADAVFALTERSKWKEAFRPRARPVCLDRAAGDPRSRDSRRSSVCSRESVFALSDAKLFGERVLFIERYRRGHLQFQARGSR